MLFSQNNDLHDATLSNIKIDYISAKIIIDIEAYENDETSTRSNLQFVLRNVKKFSAISNVSEILKNNKIGNVNYAKQSETSKFYFYLNEGILEITAESIDICDNS